MVIATFFIKESSISRTHNYDNKKDSVSQTRSSTWSWSFSWTTGRLNPTLPYTFSSSGTRSKI